MKAYIFEYKLPDGIYSDHFFGKTKEDAQLIAEQVLNVPVNYLGELDCRIDCDTGETTYY